MTTLDYMLKSPRDYLAIVDEIDKYTGAALFSDQIEKRVFYRIEKLQTKEKGQPLTTAALCRLTKKAAAEILKRKRQVEVLTDDNLLTLHADNVRNIDDLTADNGILSDIIRMATSNDERFIINAWANGCTDTEIAQALASQHGGTIEGNRSKIRRYKSKMRKDEKVIKALTA